MFTPYTIKHASIRFISCSIYRNILSALRHTTMTFRYLLLLACLVPISGKCSGQITLPGEAPLRGCVTNILETSKEVGGRQRSRLHYKYDAHGRLLSKDVYFTNLTDADSDNDRYVYSYNNAGLMISAEVYDLTQHAVHYGHHSYEYNAHGQLTADIGTDRINPMGARTFRYHYDDSGRLVQADENTGNNVPYRKSIYTYQNGVVTERGYEIPPDPGIPAKNYQITRHVYDSAGNTRVAYDYGGRDEITRTTTYTYSYDAHGNWIVKTEAINGIKLWTTKRTITYCN